MECETARYCQKPRINYNKNRTQTWRALLVVNKKIKMPFAPSTVTRGIRTRQCDPIPFISSENVLYYYKDEQICECHLFHQTKPIIYIARKLPTQWSKEQCFHESLWHFNYQFSRTYFWVTFAVNNKRIKNSFRKLFKGKQLAEVMLCPQQGKHSDSLHVFSQNTAPEQAMTDPKEGYSDRINLPKDAWLR